MRYSLYFLTKKTQEFEVDINWAINQRLEYLNIELANYNDQLLELKKQAVECDPNDVWFLNIFINEITEKIMVIKSDLLSLQNHNYYRDTFDDGITSEDIERARNYPIEFLLPPTGRGKNISCPFHEDEHPSMGIKYNRARCFACLESFDTIALVMAMHRMKFTEAVHHLSRM